MTDSQHLPDWLREERDAEEIFDYNAERRKSHSPQDPNVPTIFDETEED